MRDQSIPLGTFKLLAPLGRGGMSEVWHAEHRQQGIPVAIKILSGEHARDAWFHRVFRDEVRAVAALDHPNIITVLDYGKLSSQAQNWSKGRLRGPMLRCTKPHSPRSPQKNSAGRSWGIW